MDRSRRYGKVGSSRRCVGGESAAVRDASRSIRPHPQALQALARRTRSSRSVTATLCPYRLCYDMSGRSIGEAVLSGLYGAARMRRPIAR
eukprot:3070018-Rhodomonas_salina.2